MPLLRLPEIMPLPLHRDVAGLGTDVFRCMHAVDPMTAVLLERPYLPTRVDIREGEEAAGDRARVLRVSRILLTATRSILRIATRLRAGNIGIP